ncbi:hypothetical protein Tco_0261797 [Tanacetum coccineum]
MSSSSSSSYRRYNQDVSNKTHCDCKPPHPILIQTAWTTDNPDRRFRGCPIRDKSKKTSIDEGIVQDAVGVMDGTSGVVSNNSFGEKHLKSEFTFIKSKFKIYDRIFGGVNTEEYWRLWFENVVTYEMLPCGSYHRLILELIEDMVLVLSDIGNVADIGHDHQEDEVMTTKDDDLLFYQDTFPVDKFVPFGKAMGSKRIEKSPTIPVAVLGLCNTLTWVEIEKKLRKKPPMKH